MKKVVTTIALAVVVTLIVVSAVLMLTMRSAHAEATWEHFNADPAYQSREAAIADAPRVLRQAGWPEPVISLLTEAMKMPGVATHVTNGMRLDFMRSGKSALWRNVVVKFKKPPRENSMEYSAPSEEWTVEWNGTAWTVGIPKVCNNIYGKRSGASKPASKPGATPPAKKYTLPPTGGPIATCPDVNFLKVNNWENRALKLPGVELTHAKEELGQKQFAGVPHVSKTHGGQFRKAYAAGELKRSEEEHVFRVSLIMTPEAQGGASIITEEEVLGDISVKGLYDALQFTRAQINKWDAIRLVEINGDVVSPPRFNATGVHELRFFKSEWDSNPVPDCIMNVHTIEKKAR